MQGSTRAATNRRRMACLPGRDLARRRSRLASTACVLPPHPSPRWTMS